MFVIQIALRKLMHRRCMAMLFSKMERALDFLTHWKIFNLMYLEEASTMDASYKE